MRVMVIAFGLLAWPAAAWEFQHDPVCMLSHETPDAAVKIIFDAGGPEYRLDVSLKGDVWFPATGFGMSFLGPQNITIGTDRHRIDGPTLTVTDSGFGNVLNGLEFNRSAAAFTETQSVELSLEGAADPVRDFRKCANATPATS